MGRALSSPAFNYYTRITSPMTLLPSSPTVRGFTANNLSGSVRYLRRPWATTCTTDRSVVARCERRLARRRLRFDSYSAACPTAGRMSFLFEAGPAACPMAGAYRFGSRRARRLARQLARVASADGSVETGPVYCPTARSYRFGSRRARRLARIASADGLDRGGPGGLPDGSLVSLRRMVHDGPGVLPDCSLAALRRVIHGDGSLDNCLTGKIS